MPEVYQGTLLSPAQDEKATLPFELIPDATVIVDDSGENLYVGPVSQAREELRGLVANAQSQSGSLIILPGSANTHCHIFQPPAVDGDLLQDEGDTLVGWLPTTLRFETLVKIQPEKARQIARAKFEMYIANGITNSLEYTTSSYEAAKIVLEVAAEMGLTGRVKVGYVCMDQNVNFIQDVNLETGFEEALRDTEKLLKEFPGQVVVIDRFPIAVSSPLRQALVKLARKYDVLYETHFDESEGEASVNAKTYNGKSIFQVLLEDGVFEPGGKVGLAHAIHTPPDIIQLIGQKISDGCEVYVRACPNSNAQLQSHMWGGRYVPFPLQAWLNAGAVVTLGLDKGAGRGVNIFAEALYERGRPHADGFRPTYLDLLRMATVDGIRSLGIDPVVGLRTGDKAGFVALNRDSVKGFYPLAPTNLETLAGVTIELGQDSRNVGAVYVGGRALKRQVVGN